MHRPDLGVEAEPAPEIAFVVEPVEEVRRQQARGGRPDRRGDGIEIHAAHRPEHREREGDQQEVPHDVEERHHVGKPEQDAVERHDREVGKVLVVEELGKALVHLRDPELEDVLAACECVARVLDEELVFCVVVHIRGWHQHFGQEPDGLHGHGKRDEEGERDIANGAPIGERAA